MPSLPYFLTVMLKVLTLLLSSLASVAGGGIHWSFGTANPLAAGSEPAETLVWTSAKKNIELVEGISGTGLRTDGYSTWLSNTQTEPVNSLSGYFALESFPTDTAAFLAVRNDRSGQSVGVAVEKFGRLLLVSGDGDRFSYEDAGGSVSRYAWSHIALVVKDGHPLVFLNGKEILRSTVRVPMDSDMQSILFGKGFQGNPRSRFQMAINGIIDEVAVNEALPGAREIAAAVAKTPRLAIPEIRFEGDFSRPTYHLIPGANWTNETHALFHYKGRYHIFNQKNASNIQLRQINWGHYSSPDLIHWTEEKVALSPDRDYDRNGIWSGHAVINDDGIPQLFYTAGKDSYGVGTAFPADEALVSWEKYAGNPVIAVKPDLYDRTDMRDQYVWKENGHWYMVVGFGITGDAPHGTLLLYRSDDLLHWTFLHLLYEGKPEIDATGEFWEMPAFVKFGDKYFLSVNRTPLRGTPARTQYWLGDFKDEKFVPDNEIPQNLEVINGLLSPSFGTTPEGETVTISIIPDKGGNSYEKGWAHLYSLPRVVDVRNGKIIQAPYPGLKTLREEHFSLDRHRLEHPIALPDMGHQYELEVCFRPGNATRFGLVLCKNPDGSEQTLLYFDRETGKLVFDKEKTSAANTAYPAQMMQQMMRAGQQGQTARPLRRVDEDDYTVSGDEVRMHLFIDGSVLEGFINDEDAFTNRLYPSKKNSTLVEIFSDGTDTEVSADMWKIADAKVKMNY